MENHSEALRLLLLKYVIFPMVKALRSPLKVVLACEKSSINQSNPLVNQCLEILPLI